MPMKIKASARSAAPSVPGSSVPDRFRPVYAAVSAPDPFVSSRSVPVPDAVPDAGSVPVPVSAAGSVPVPVSAAGSVHVPVPVSVPDPRSETRDFIAMMFLTDDVLPVPITAEDAAYDMSNWTADGVDYPAGMTPALFAEVWNEMIMEV